MGLKLKLGEVSQRKRPSTLTPWGKFCKFKQDFLGFVQAALARQELLCAALKLPQPTIETAIRHTLDRVSKSRTCNPVTTGTVD